MATLRARITCLIKFKEILQGLWVDMYKVVLGPIDTDTDTDTTYA
jgi:hypothetical protein